MHGGFRQYSMNTYLTKNDVIVKIYVMPYYMLNELFYIQTNDDRSLLKWVKLTFLFVWLVFYYDPTSAGKNWANFKRSSSLFFTGFHLVLGWYYEKFSDKSSPMMHIKSYIILFFTNHHLVAQMSPSQRLNIFTE